MMREKCGKKACSGGSVDKALKGRDEGVGVYILNVDFGLGCTRIW